MARKFLSPLRLYSAASNPTGAAGDIMYNTSTGFVVHNGTTWNSLNGGGGSSDPRLNVVTGYYYGPATDNTTAGATVALANDRMVAVPILIGSTGWTADRIGIAITGASASTNIRLCIYNSNTAKTLPDTLLLNAGTVDSSTTGNKEITISQALAADTLYWLVAISNGAPTVRSRNSSTFGVGFPTLADIAGTPGSYWRDSAGSYTTPPAYGTPGGTLGSQIAIMLRAA